MTKRNFRGYLKGGERRGERKERGRRGEKEQREKYSFLFTSSASISDAGARGQGGLCEA